MFYRGKVWSLMRESEFQLEHALDSVKFIHRIRRVLSSATEGGGKWSPGIVSLIDQIDKIIEHTPENYGLAEWHVMIAGLRVLVSQDACLTIAQGGEGDLLVERARCDVLVGELQRQVSSESIVLLQATNSIRKSLFQTGQLNSEELRIFLLSIPLPTLYWHSRETKTPHLPLKEHEAIPNPMLRVIIFLDHAPIASPQLLKPNLLYPLVFRVRGLTWPDDAIRLRLDLLTTCPSSEFTVSEFTLAPPHPIENEEYQGELAGNIKFSSGQSSMLDDLVFIVRGAFETSVGDYIEIPVIGHNELRLRVVNEDGHPLMTGNRRLDRHIEELATKLISDCPRVRDEMLDLFGMLQALTRLLATYAQEAVYKGRSDVSELEFQAMVLRDLRFILGQDVQEHPSQAGGITDIRYRGVIVELKVEKENGSREHISKQYTAQPAQYAGVEARQVSVLLVLDLTSKDKPTSDIRNDIIIIDVETHGGDDGTKKFPSKAFVFVINGNMKSP
jgi:hypothetical protein